MKNNKKMWLNNSMQPSNEEYYKSLVLATLDKGFLDEKFLIACALCYEMAFYIFTPDSTSADLGYGFFPPDFSDYKNV
jgi:hypothetical protein